MYTFLAKLRKFLDDVSFSRQFRLAGNDVREFSRKSIIAMYNQFNQNLSLEWIFFGVVQIWRTINCFFVFVFVLCRAIMLFGDERSLKKPAFECNTGWERPGNFYFFKHCLFSRVQKKNLMAYKNGFSFISFSYKCNAEIFSIKQWLCIWT